LPFPLGWECLRWLVPTAERCPWKVLQPLRALEASGHLPLTGKEA